MKVSSPWCIIQKTPHFKANPQWCVYSSWSVICIDFSSKQPSLYPSYMQNMWSWTLGAMNARHNSIDPKLFGGWRRVQMFRSAVTFWSTITQTRFHHQIRHRKLIQSEQFGIINWALRDFDWKRDMMKTSTTWKASTSKWLILMIWALSSKKHTDSHSASKHQFTLICLHDKPFRYRLNSFGYHIRYLLFELHQIQLWNLAQTSRFP